jgi:hypothetical protein
VLVWNGWGKTAPTNNYFVSEHSSPGWGFDHDRVGKQIMIKPPPTGAAQSAGDPGPTTPRSLREERLPPSIYIFVYINIYIEGGCPWVLAWGSALREHAEIVGEACPRVCAPCGACKIQTRCIKINISSAESTRSNPEQPYTNNSKKLSLCD